MTDLIYRMTNISNLGATDVHGGQTLRTLSSMQYSSNKHMTDLIYHMTNLSNLGATDVHGG